MSELVGIVGLGLMGVHLARRLLAEGRQVIGYDTDPQRATELTEVGGRPVGELAEVSRSAHVIVLSLPNGAVSSEVCLGDEGIETLAGSNRPLIIDTTTARPSEAIELGRRLGVEGFQFLDVGLSGSGPMIGEGRGLGIVGGPVAAYVEAETFLRSMCGTVMRVGDHGAGMTAKLVINLVMYVNRLALAEGLLLADRSGISPGTMLEALQASAARSTAMEIWGRRMVDGRFDQPTSRIRQHVKDVQQIRELVDAAQLRLLAFPQVAIVAEAAIAAGLHDSDNSVVIDVLRRLSSADQEPAGLAGNHRRTS